MNSDFRVFNYLKNREQGLFFKHRRIQLSVQQNLVTKNSVKTETLRDAHPSFTKAFLIVMSNDKSYFAIATSDNAVGIYCSISGELMYKLNGSQYPIFTIAWHPNFKNIIACSNLCGEVFVWDILQSDRKDCQFQKIWNWTKCSSITYSIGFHPFKPIISLARDREIRFIDWEKGSHIAQWRFFSELAWVTWVSWSFVGSSIIASLGNPQSDGVLNSILQSITFDEKSLSPIESGCTHYNNNHLCEICDTCEKMSILDNGPPKFEEYRVNAVDLIRYVLSRPEEWFAQIFVCVDCRMRFKIWANSIQIHNKYDMDANMTKQKSQLPNDVESTFITIIETPVAPEIVWNLLQKSNESSFHAADKRIEQYLIPKSEPNLLAESQNLLRCVAMFERECLRQSICWYCIQQIHNWIILKKDFPLFLYDSMIQVRKMVIERIQDYDNNLFKMDHKQNGENKGETDTSCMNAEKNDGDSLLHSQNVDCTIAQYDDIFTENQTNNDLKTASNQDQSLNKNIKNHITNPNSNMDSFFDDSDLPSVSSNDNINDIIKRIKYLHLTLEFLQFYVSEPSRFGELINFYMANNLNQSGMMMGPIKVDTYSVRKWHLQPLGSTPQKISPRHNYAESHLIIPHVKLSHTGIAEASIRMSKCGRTIAVLVPRDSFMHQHSKELSKNDYPTRKRRYTQAFYNFRTPISNSPVVAIYASEPESCCGQLLYYFEIHLNAISLDFSPLGDHLIVGLSGSRNQSFLVCENSEFKNQTNNSLLFMPPSDSLCNIGIILKINPTKEECVDNADDKIHSPITKGPKPMQPIQIINHDKSVIHRGFSDANGYNGPINCVVWNTAGGLIYSTYPGTVLSLNYVGCNG